MNPNRVIFITTLTLWSMGKGHGGPAFTKTVQKYIDEGWEVYLISDEPSNQDFPSLDATHNIFLRPTIFKRFNLLRKIGLFFRWLDHRIMTRRFCRVACAVIDDNCENTILYAYEIFGVEACRRLSQKKKIPFVTRFQGTILAWVPNTFINRFRRFMHFQALSTPANCVIMTDDGSFGARTLRNLGNTSPTLFLRNGLDLVSMDISSMKAAFDRQAFRTSLGVDMEEPMFLTVSRLVNWKRLDRSIDGFADYCKTHSAGKLVIVGSGDQQANLERYATSLGIKSRVIFTGSVPHDNVYQYMMACDIFLSLYDLTNLGNPLFEAMALGKCIITLDLGDTRSVIQNGENAFLLTLETLPTLGSVLSLLVKDSTLRQKLGAGAAAYAQEHFQTWEQRMDTEFQAVSALLEKSSI